MKQEKNIFKLYNRTRTGVPHNKTNIYVLFIIYFILIINFFLKKNLRCSNIQFNKKNDLTKI